MWRKSALSSNFGLAVSQLVASLEWAKNPKPSAAEAFEDFDHFDAGDEVCG